MAIKKFSWDDNTYQDYDIHLVRNGKSNDALISLMFLHDDLLGNVFLNDAAGLANIADYDRVEFVPEILNPNYNNVTHLYSFNDVVIDKNTGVIQANVLSVGGDELKAFNFVLKATLYIHNSDDLERRFRVHIHNSISAAWVTPATLTVRPDLPGYRFSVYAEFDDGMVGDISYQRLVWTCSNINGDATVGIYGGITVNSNIVGSAGITITASFPSSSAVNNNLPNGISITPGTLDIKKSWKNPPANSDKIKITPILDNLNLPGSKNILILGDGYQNSADFNKDTETLKTDLLAAAHLSPWNLMAKSSVNFWKGHIDSIERSGTILNEMICWPIPLEAGGFEYNYYISVDSYITQMNSYFIQNSKCILKDWSLFINLDRTRKEPYDENSVELTLGELIDKVGFPTLHDKNASVAAVHAKWQALFDPNITIYNPANDIALYNPAVDPKVVPPDLYQFWLRLADRTLFNERNSVFGLRLGDKPKLSNPTHSRLSGFNEVIRRPSRNDLNELLLNSVTSTVGFTPNLAWTFSSGNPNRIGSDIDFILFLMKGGRKSGTHTGATILGEKHNLQLGIKHTSQTTVVTTTNPGVYSIAVPQRRVLNFSDFDYVHDIHSITALTAHEFSHCLGLGDEYDSNGKSITVIDTKLQESIDQHRNVQLRSNLLINGNMGDNIRWRFLRQHAGGVIQSAIQSYTNQNILYFKIQLGKYYSPRTGETINQIENFPDDSIAFVRRRLIEGAVSASQTPSSILVPYPAANTPIPYFSPPLRIVSKNLVTGEIEVKLENSADNFNIADFGKDDVFFAPVLSDFVGLGTITANGTTVLGVETKFKLYLEPGYQIKTTLVGAGTRTVQSVADDGTLTIDSAFDLPIANEAFTVLPTNRYAELVNDTIRRVINISDKPMTVDPCVATVEEPNIQQPLFGNLIYDPPLFLDPELLLTPNVAFLNTIVGLYANGEEYACGIYHPTGICNMRNTSNHISNMFCPVCRYILVNNLAPELMGDMDTLYVLQNELIFK
ncbi:MAG: hypothetical protein ABIQ40_02055 [Bacteroidia bacterium]